MKSLLVLLIALFALCAAQELEVPVREFAPSPRITGGTLTQWGEYPATVWIDSPFLTHNCVGTLVNRDHVLTAASCVTNLQGQLQNSFWYRIFAGDINITPVSARREVRNVTRMYVHHNYNWNTRNNDLAVLRVNMPFTEFHNSIEPAMRNPSFFTVANQQCRFAGWGAQANVSDLFDDSCD
jgi:secreted trypsin-like serine protease